MNRNLMNELTEGIEVLSKRRNITIEELRDILTAIVNRQQEELKEIEQILGKVLGYPFCKTEQKNYFPDGSESDGVCIGDNNAVSLANEAAKRIEYLEDEWMEHISLN